jgi:hypothetical protein
MRPTVTPMPMTITIASIVINVLSFIISASHVCYCRRKKQHKSYLGNDTEQEIS